MQYRPMEITVISAKGLKRVKHLSKMDVYVVVSLSGGPEIEQKTPVDKGSGPNPNWNFPMSFNVDEDEAAKGRLSLSFKVMCHRRIHSDKDIGQADVPLKELLDNGGDGRFVKYVTYQLKKPNGKHRGELNLSYKFAAQRLEGSSSVKLHPEPPAAPAYPPAGYPPPPAPFPGLQPHHNPVGYVPVYGNYLGGCGQSSSSSSSQDQRLFGFGYNPQVVRPESESSSSSTAGAGVDSAFLSGVLGGLLIGEMLGNGGGPEDLAGGPYCDGAGAGAGAGYEFYDAPAGQGGPVGPGYEASPGHELGGGAC